MSADKPIYSNKSSNRAQNDRRIEVLHGKAKVFWPQLEAIIDELKELSPHSLDGNNTLMNIREWLAQLSRR